MKSTLFERPSAAALLPADIGRDARLSACGQYRFTLTRVWRGGPHVCWIGLNPSTADHRGDDPTVRRWIAFARAWGFGGFVAVNLYPFRTPNPEACRRWANWPNNGPDWHARDVIMHNVDVVAAEAKRAALVVACWGADPWDETFVEHVIEEITSGEAPYPTIHCLGRTLGGDPIHPMARGRHRVPDDAKPAVWREP